MRAASGSDGDDDDDDDSTEEAGAESSDASNKGVEMAVAMKNLRSRLFAIAIDMDVDSDDTTEPFNPMIATITSTTRVTMRRVIVDVLCCGRN